MQAIFFFALFGLFFAVIQGLISGSAQSAIQLKEAQIAGTNAFFRDVQNLITLQTIPENLRVPDLGNTVGAYLDQGFVREGVNWNYSPTTTEDPWQRPFTGHVVHQRIPVRSQTDGGQVHLPVTAFVLVSAGPDRQVDPALSARLGSLSSASEIRDVLNIDAPSNSDDIVYTFSTFNALENRWQEVEDRVNEIAQTVNRIYSGTYFVLLEQLIAIYGADYLNFFDDSGSLQITPANVAQWRADGITTPLPDMSNFTNGDILGSNGAQEYIRNETNLRIRFESFRSTAGIGQPECLSAFPTTLSDRLRVCISNNGSPWGDNGGRLFYYQDVEGEQS